VKVVGDSLTAVGVGELKAVCPPKTKPVSGFEWLTAGTSGEDAGRSK